MSNLGLGVMIGMLGGNQESAEACTKALNKKISKMYIEKDSLHIELEDGYKIRLFDDGQSCCESRYMTGDESVEPFIGAVLLSVEIESGPDLSSPDGESHDTEKLAIRTDKGYFTVLNHNEHNGYYGGFLVRCEEE